MTTMTENTTRAYPEKKGTDKVWETCGKCGGDKVVHWGNVSYSNGRGEARWCFDCDGQGGRYVLVSSIRAREARQRKATEQAAQRAAEFAAQAAAQEAVEQARKAAREAARQAERDAAEDVPTGREVVTGEIVSIKEQQDQFKYYEAYITKMLVRDDRGFKVYGTMPANLDAAPGDRVTFTANLKPSNDDPKFGFLSRPTKAGKID